MQALGNPFPVPRPADAEMTFACAASDHQGLHREETRELAPDTINGLTKRPGKAFGQILVDEKERLNRSDFVFGILKDKKKILEPGREGRSDKFVKAVVLELIAKCLRPGGRVF